MRPRRNWVAWATVMAMAGSTAACGSGGPTGHKSSSYGTTRISKAPSPASASSSSTPASRSTTPTIPPFTYAWTDSQGYSYKIIMSDYDIDAAVNTADQPPGQALVSITTSANGAITNTTAGRNAPEVRSAGIAPLFKASSPLCRAAATDNLGIIYVSQGPGNQLSDPVANKSFCFLAPLSEANSSDIPAGTTATYDYTGSHQLTIAESDVAAAKAELAHPAYWVLTDHSVESADNSDPQGWCYAGDAGDVGAIVQSKPAGLPGCVLAGG